MKYIADSLKALNNNIEKIGFYTLDGAIIPEVEVLKHRNNIPFIMSIQRAGSEVKWNYAINLNEGFTIGHGGETKIKSSEEAYLEYCQGIGLPRYTSFVLANFASKLHQTLPRESKASSETIIKGLIQTMSYFRSLGNHKSLLKVSDIERLLSTR